MTDKLLILRDKMIGDLTGNILPFWMEKAIDNENGGWYGEVLRDGTVNRDAKKSLVLNARILWTFSSAYRVLKKPEYLDMAKRAFDYFCRYFLDPDGGVWYMLNADGSPADRTKFTYGQGYALYAFAEYARATGGEGLVLADRMFEYIEKECRTDAGYPEYPRGTPALESRLGQMLTMNTHLHVAEPVTNYLRVRRTERVEEALRNLLDIFLHRIISKDTPHFDLFFTRDWDPVVRVNSYGHDIEGSWLIHEAAEVLGDETLLERVKAAALAMAEDVYEKGRAESGAICDHGERDGKPPEPKFVWWGQAEGIVGFVNAYILSGDEKFLNAAVRCWEYTENKIINPDGEWFATGLDSMEDENTPFLVNAWKCPYHNARAALEIYERCAGRERA